MLPVSRLDLIFKTQTKLNLALSAIAKTSETHSQEKLADQKRDKIHFQSIAQQIQAVLKSTDKSQIG